jgi:hypothetical protein
MFHRLVAVVLLLPITAAGADATAVDESVRCVETDAAITVYAGEKRVLQYNKAPVEPPAGIDPVYRRSGYIHPIWSPSGKIVTGDFAPDHPHQHGLFFAYVNTMFKGEKIDFWNQVKKTGDVSHRRVLGIENGDGFAQFRIELAHDAFIDNQRITALIDTWTVRIDAIADGVYQFDIQCEQQCATDSPLIILEYHYGAMGIRGAGDWYQPGAAKAYRQWEQQSSGNPRTIDPPGLDVMGHDFLTSAGKSRHDGNHTPARWASIYGRYRHEASTGGQNDSAGAAAGVAVLSHPTNFRAPQSVRLHPDKPYFCFAPMVQGQYEIIPAEPLRSRYRFIVYDGLPHASRLNQLYDAYAR